MRRNKVGHLLLGLTVLAAACSSPSRPAPTGPAQSSSPTSVSSPTAVPGDDDAPLPSPPPVAAASSVAAGFAQAWVRGSTDPEGWWDGLRPWCQDGLAQTLRSTEPGNVPARQITGAPKHVGGSAQDGLRFEVPTDTGTLQLTLAAIDGRWLVSEVDFTRSPA